MYTYIVVLFILSTTDSIFMHSNFIFNVTSNTILKDYHDSKLRIIGTWKVSILSRLVVYIAHESSVL